MGSKRLVRIERMYDKLNRKFQCVRCLNVSRTEIWMVLNLLVSFQSYLRDTASDVIPVLSSYSSREDWRIIVETPGGMDAEMLALAEFAYLVSFYPFGPLAFLRKLLGIMFFYFLKATLSKS